MTLPCRCHNRINGKTCFTRKSLAQRPEHYVRQPRCPSCGARKWAIDKWRIKHEIWGYGDTCNCGGYWFPHRKGSKYCEWHPEWETLSTDRR